MSRQAYFSKRVVTAEGERAGAVIVEDGKIVDVVAREEIGAGVAVEDFGDVAILPGLVDSHVHINEPGRTEWEGFETATRAAAAGGYTLLVDMPLNCVPATTSVAALEAKRAAARDKCFVDWLAWGGVVRGNHEEIEALAQAGVAGFKCFLVHPGIEEFTQVGEAELRLALPRLAKTSLPLLVHAELAGPIDAATAKLKRGAWSEYATYLSSRPDEAELEAIEMMLRLCRKFRFRLHIVHVATSHAVALLREARKEDLAVTAESCPHYLHLAAEEIPDGATQFKCAPPIRTRANADGLWEGLREGVIDLVATDHSPCPPEMKRFAECDFRTAWGGIASLSVALPVVWTEAKRRGFGLREIARWMAEAPAKLAGCSERKGKIAAGYDADFVVFEPEPEFVVKKERLYYRHAVSPYLGEKLLGVVRATYLRGELVFDGEEILGRATGRECVS